MAKVKSLYPSDEQYAEYWTAQKKRAQARVNKSLEPMFDKAKLSCTDAILGTLGNRRYIKEQDLNRRLRLIKRDPKLKQIENTIKRLGEKSLQALYENQNPHYKEEVQSVAEILYPVYYSIGSFTNVSLTGKEQVEVRNKPFQGYKFNELININTQNAIKSWGNNFRQVMSRQDDVSREALLVKAVKKLLDKQLNQNKVVMENSQIEISRKAQKDVEVAIW